jgi:hypothetical protein
MDKQSILLPVNASREPDWLYMELYVKTMINRHIDSYFAHKSSL